MFKFRFGGQGGSSPTQPPTIETVRRRARHRLIGATVLVATAVVGFPLLFESQPRPVPVDFEIEIPSKASAQPLAQRGDPEHPVTVRLDDALDEKDEIVRPGQSESASVKTAAVAATAAAVAGVAAAGIAAQPHAPKPAAAPEHRPVFAAPAIPPAAPRPRDDRLATKPAEKRHEPKPADKLTDRKLEARLAEKKPEPKPIEKKPAADKPVADSARARALLASRAEAKHEAKVEPKQRSAVQIGAFADAERAREMRQKLERAGLPTYVTVTETPTGKRTRVRAGPFASRADADKAAARIKSLGLPAAVLTP